MVVVVVVAAAAAAAAAAVVVVGVVVVVVVVVAAAAAVAAAAVVLRAAATAVVEVVVAAAAVLTTRVETLPTVALLLLEVRVQELVPTPGLPSVVVKKGRQAQRRREPCHANLHGNEWSRARLELEDGPSFNVSVVVMVDGEQPSLWWLIQRRSLRGAQRVDPGSKAAAVLSVDNDRRTQLSDQMELYAAPGAESLARKN